MDCAPSGSRECSALPTKTITRRELFTVLKDEHFFKLSSSKCNVQLIDYVMNKFEVNELPLDSEKHLKSVIKVFVSKLFVKWKEARHYTNRFLNKNSRWLDMEVRLPQMHKVVMLPTQIDSSVSKKGRPKKLFSETSKRSKQRAIKQLVSKATPEELCSAAESSLVKSGRRASAKVVQLAVTTTPRRLKRMKEAHSTSLTFTPYSPKEALAFIIDCGLGKEEYICIQRGAKERGANIYPSYNSIAVLKKQCYPPNIIVTETEALIPLQDLLDLTIRHLVEVQFEILLKHIPDDVTFIDVIYKWGLDGSGGHSIYKNNFSDNSLYADSNIILCTIVPLEMSVKIVNKKIICWKNLSPSSTRHCRPIGFKIKKETDETMKEEYQNIQNQIAHLEPTKIHLTEDRELFFNHIPVCTMLDGKTCNVLTHTSSTQACNVCKVTPKDINDLPKVLARPCDKSTYKFGISVLHAYLRCFEFLLHISYKLDCKVWQARGSEAKESVRNRKKVITEMFYKEMGLVVDQPKQGGGNSNDGNTARKFFDSPNKVAEITGLNSDLISRFATVLCALSSGHYIEVQTFRVYCMETARLCIQLYGWYKMSATVHKLFIHGSDIIESLPLPVGQLSEDVLEASHKDYKHMRLFHSRKTSRINTNTDILNRMLISSDPIISSYRKVTKKRRKPFPQEVINMLEIPDFLRQSPIDQADDIVDDFVDDEIDSD